MNAEQIIVYGRMIDALCIAAGLSACVIFGVILSRLVVLFGQDYED